jgi:hypothetical protein
VGIDTLWTEGAAGKKEIGTRQECSRSPGINPEFDPIGDMPQVASTSTEQWG